MNFSPLFSSSHIQKYNGTHRLILHYYKGYKFYHLLQYLKHLPFSIGNLWFVHLNLLKEILKSVGNKGKYFSKLWLCLKILKLRHLESSNIELYQVCLNWSIRRCFLSFLLNHSYQEHFGESNIQIIAII